MGELSLSCSMGLPYSKRISTQGTRLSTVCGTDAMVLIEVKVLRLFLPSQVNSQILKISHTMYRASRKEQGNKWLSYEADQ